MREVVLGPVDFPPRDGQPVDDDLTESLPGPPDESVLPPAATLDADHNEGALKNGEVFREHAP
jgi:hypothetical protein